jgi:hypothetical protein
MGSLSSITATLINLRRGIVFTTIVSGGRGQLATHKTVSKTFQLTTYKSNKIVDVDGPLHIHVASFYNITGFWNGDLERAIHIIQKRGKKKRPNQTTTVSTGHRRGIKKENQDVDWTT